MTFEKLFRAVPIFQIVLRGSKQVVLGDFGGDWHAWNSAFQSFQGTLKGGFFVGGIGDG